MFEYMVVRICSGTKLGFENQPNSIGAEGWRVCKIIKEIDLWDYNILFERKVK